MFFSASLLVGWSVGHENNIHLIAKHIKKSMFTTKITIKPHLSEYLKGKYNCCNDGPISFPDSHDIYIVLFDLLIKRPAHGSLDDGNTELVLPNRKVGKNPEYYNYMSEKAVRIFEKRIELLFWADLHEHLDFQKHMNGYEISDSVYIFMSKYNIDSITSDALLKNYYRWRDRIRKKEKKRAYKRC